MEFSRGAKRWFFWLGRAIRLGEPVAVVTTSGTAAAELLPAAIEAHYQAIPLILITADRPPRFRGTGAPQAIEQVGLFGPFVDACCDLATAQDDATKLGLALANWSRRRPFHLNVCFEEPRGEELERADGVLTEPQEQDSSMVRVADGIERFLDREGKLLAVVGSLASVHQREVADFLRRVGCGVYAEATSGLREDAEIERQLLRGGEASVTGFGATSVMRIGGVPTARFWRDLEERAEVDVFSVTDTGFSGLARRSEVAGFPGWEALTATVAAPDLASDRARAQHVIEVLERFPESEPAMVRALSATIPERALVFLGNSLPIREWDAFAVTSARGLRCFANRGANGIDGCVSTFLGLGADEPESWCLIGDLTALYDLGAPWITRSLSSGRRRIVIISNGGGRIFSRVRALRALKDSERALMENPHGLNFNAWADFWGWDYLAVATPAELPPSIEARHVIIELMPNPEQTDMVWEALDEA